jgi:hypothetical protein
MDNHRKDSKKITHIPLPITCHWNLHAANMHPLEWIHSKIQTWNLCTLIKYFNKAFFFVCTKSCASMSRCGQIMCAEHEFVPGNILSHWIQKDTVLFTENGIRDQDLCEQ